MKQNDIERSQAEKREAYITTQLNNQSKDKTVGADFLNAIEQLLKPYNCKVIDPLNLEEKINVLQAEVDSFRSEVETLIKISNATTYVEF
jgi:bisphosphoglycerate-dependent phosphoglycerate mutase